MLVRMVEHPLSCKFLMKCPPYFIHTCKSEILGDRQLNLFMILLHDHMYSLLLVIIKTVYLSFYDMSKYLILAFIHSLAKVAEAIHTFFS